MPYRTRALKILEDWREAERLYERSTDQATRDELQGLMDGLKQAYQRVVHEARVAEMPEPPGFPASPGDAG